MKAFYLGASALIAVASAAPASAASYLFSFDSGAFTGSGTFVTADTTTTTSYGTGYLITAITGGTVTVTASGNQTSTMLLAPRSYEGNDNVLYVNGTTSGHLLDVLGYSFTFGSNGGQSGNIYYSNGYDYLTTNSRVSSGVLTSFTITPATTGAVPEPASWAMLLSGFGLTGAALRRRSVRMAVQAI